MSKKSLFPSLASFALIVTACSAPAPAPTGGGQQPGGGDGDEEAGVYPKEVFTGFDGEHDFVVPVSSIGGKATWTAKDAAIVSLVASDEGVKIKTKKAGTTTLTAKIGSKSFTVKVNVASYGAGAWAKGEAVYKTSVKCSSCHMKAKGPDHSPTEIGKHEDEHIQKRILTGESLHGEAPQPNHKFESKLADGDLEGVLAYLRALTPAGWPEEAHDHEHED